jgi:serine/threonine-protein kinase
MQPPIRLGTVLQSRYRLIQILGQGGFGRTYLAEDIGRFNELCALKELIPTQAENYALEKSKELFQREAAILYQIQHPQVPQFRATFEQDRRLFLVQDYVAGKTYSVLLDERKAAGQTFSEAEVLQLLRQLLPVLAHIHTRGIVHRDISPDNIILRESDAKPVLIDFGVVKELATKFQSGSDRFSQATTVGKFGYAPSEQIQTGRAYPSSDLYSLAVTAVVLLSSREPQELFDDTNLTWNWQQWVAVSPALAQVLNRMLSYKPSDRYQSVAEVAKALQGIEPQTTSLQPPMRSHSQPAAVSQLQTVAVARRPDLVQPHTGKPNRPEPVIKAPKTRPIWGNPWALIPILVVVAVLAGIGGWALMSAILNSNVFRGSSNQPPVPQDFPSPVIPETSQLPTPTPTFTPAPTPTIGNEPITYTQSLNLVPGSSTTVESILKANTSVNYTFNGEQGQQLTATLAEEGVLLTVLGPDGTPIDREAVQVSRYQGTLLLTGQYTVQLSSVQGIDENRYKLTLDLESAAVPSPTATLTPTPDPRPSVVVPTVETESLELDGETETRVSGATQPQQIKRYLVNVEQGQQLSIAVTKGAVTVDIRDPDGQLLENASRLLNWQGEVSRSGNYQIDVIPIPKKEIDFALNVRVSN